MRRCRCRCLILPLLTLVAPRAHAFPAQAASAVNNEVIAHFEAGQRASSSGQFDRAVAEYQVVLRLEPTLTEARVNLGLAYHALGQYSLAVAELEKALRQRPSLVGANLFLGIDYLKLGLPRKAMGPLQAALRAEPYNREAQRALAACLLGQDQYTQALEQFRALASSEADPSEGLYTLGQSYLDLAKQLSGRMSQHHENSAWANRLAGDLLAERHQWTDAAVLYQKAIALDPKQPGLRASLGSMYLHQGKVQAAEGEFQKGLELDSKNEPAWIGLAEVQLVNGATRVALESVSKIWEIFPPFLGQQTSFPSVELSPERVSQLTAELENAPDSPSKYFLLSNLYRNPAIPGSATENTSKARQQWAALQEDLAGWHEKSVSKSETAARLCQSHLYVACASRLQSEEKRSAAEGVLLGEALLAVGEDSQAAGTFAAALSSDTTNLRAAYWLARTYTKLATASFDRLMEEFPDSWHAHQFRGEADELRFAYDDAVRELQLAIRSRPDAPELHEALGRLYFLKKSFPQAEEELKTAVQLDPGRAPSLFLLGRLRLDRHQAPESIPYLQTALRYDPNLLEARAALGQAYMRSGQAEQAVPQLERAASTDTYGDLHYLLYVAYRKLGKDDLATKALARSQELRKSSATLHQEKVKEAGEEETQP